MVDIQADVVVLGAGPGGYTAAFRAADLGKKVILIDAREHLGGVCLNVGCIPSKTLLHLAKVVDDAKDSANSGIDFGEPKIDVNKMRDYKNNVIGKLTAGLKMLAEKRKVQVIQAHGKFISKNQLEITNSTGKQVVAFKDAIIAVGSEPINLPFLPDDPRIINSTNALEIKDVKGEMLIIGGGIIGLEMATIYNALGTKVTIVEFLGQIAAMIDKDIIMPLNRFMRQRCENVFLETKVTKVDARKDGLYVEFEGKHATAEPKRFDYILCAVGRTPNGKLIGAESAGVNVDDKGFILVDEHLRTNVANIYAVGDVVGSPMLAHKAIAEGRVAAEVIAGLNSVFKPKCIPSVAYTDPEVAVVGLNEKEAVDKNINYGVGLFPWAASGRSLSQNRNEGKTKLIFAKDTDKLIGAEVVGPNAGELIAELALAIENELSAQDITKTIHPHPTLSETVALAAEVYEGTATDIL